MAFGFAVDSSSMVEPKVPPDAPEESANAVGDEVMHTWVLERRQCNAQLWTWQAPVARAALGMEARAKIA